MMTSEQQLYFLLDKISDVRKRSPSGTPLIIDPTNDLNRKYRAIELGQFFAKLEKDEHILKIIKAPNRLKSIDFIEFLDPYEQPDDGCWHIELLPAFEEYYLKIQEEPEYEDFTGKKSKRVSGHAPSNLSLLHPEVFSKCQSLFEKAEFAEAVEKSFKIVRDKLRDLTGYERGSDAFGKTKLHIRGAVAKNVDNDFNEGVKFLTMAIDMFRNEKSHTSNAKIDNPQTAYEYLSMSSLAMHCLDRAEIIP